MDWLLKHSVIRQYLQTNFRGKEFKRAIKYTLIIGIQTLYQLHGNSSSDPHVSFTLEQLSSMIVSNSGTLQLQSDLPALNKCLKDIKSQLGDIQNELDSRTSTKPVRAPSASNTEKFVTNIMKRNTSNIPNAKENKSKPTASKSVDNIENANVLNKADSKWRTGAAPNNPLPNANAVYPEWWPNDDRNDNGHQIKPEEAAKNETNEEEQIVRNTNNHECAPSVQHPHVYSQPIAFSVPKSQFGKDADNNIVQLHVNLYPEYMQKCLDGNAMNKVSNREINDDYELSPRQDRNKGVNNKKKRNSKCTKRGKNGRSKSLTRCTESSQAKANGKQPQSAYLKANHRNIAPCLKYQKPHSQRNKCKGKRRKSLPNKSSKVPKYLQNIESRIKGELRRDRKRNNRSENERQSLLENIVKYGLSENANDQYYDEWKEQFGYDRIGADDITKPSVVSVADAMMHSDIIQAMNPSFTKEPTIHLDTEYDRMMFDKENNSNRANDSVINNMDFLSDLRDWASGLTSND